MGYHAQHTDKESNTGYPNQDFVRSDTENFSASNVSSKEFLPKQILNERFNSLFDSYFAYLNTQVADLQQQDKEKDKIISELKDSLVEMTINYTKEKKDNERLRKENDELKADRPIIQEIHHLTYNIKEVDFSEATAQYIERLWDVILELFNEMDDTGNYRMREIKHVALIFIILKDSNFPHVFKKSFRELYDLWRKNTIRYLSPERAKDFELTDRQLDTGRNDKSWTEVSPVSWKNMKGADYLYASYLQKKLTDVK